MYTSAFMVPLLVLKGHVCPPKTNYVQTLCYLCGFCPLTARASPALQELDNTQFIARRLFQAQPVSPDCKFSPQNKMPNVAVIKSGHKKVTRYVKTHPIP